MTTSSFIKSAIICLVGTLYLDGGLAWGVEWDGFLGKFTKQLFGNDGFFDLPFTRPEAAGLRLPYIDTGVQHPEFQLKIYCLSDDPHVCMLFDKNDRIAGLRISRIKSDLANDLSQFPYKYEEVSIFNSTKFLGRDVYYTDFLFTNPDNLKEGGRGKISKEEPADGLWVRLSEGWTEIPKDECTAKNKGWKKQGFIPWMGNHYSFGQTDDCSKYLPLLPIYHKKRLIALSFAPMGGYKPVSRKWFEDVPADVIQRIVPDGYKPCLQDWTAKYSVRSFHFYFIKHPRFILWDQSATC